MVPYVILFVLFAIAFALTLRMPEPVAERSRLRLTPQRPSVPPVVRGPFLLAGLGVLSSWSIAGLFFSLGPPLSADMFAHPNHIVTGLSVFVLAGSAPWRSSCSGAARRGSAPLAGSLALAGGLLMIVLAAAETSGALLMIGAVIAGAGFGVAFLGSLRALSVAIPHEHRAQVMSAFYIVAYASLSLPAVLAGIVVTPLGLESTFEIFGSVIAAIALVLAIEATRTRPRQLAMATG